MRVLVVQRSLAPPGGGNAVAAWMLHALAGQHHLGTVTLRDWSVPETNAFYGTSIPETDLIRHIASLPWRWLASLPEHRARHLSMSAVFRQARPLASQYDLLLTADNYGAFSRPGIQYLHYPAPLVPSARGAVVRWYFRFSDRLAGMKWRDVARNVTLANSHWTKTALERERGLRADVLYPPVVDPGDGLPWEQRSNSVLCIGRFHGSKRIERAMWIVQRLRAHALPDARLVIVGSAVDRDYTARIRHFAARDRDWIEFREDLSRSDTNALIGRCRYGLQPMVDEHFGMATAEMARGGCVVFAHDSGGSPEVLAGERALLWRTEDDAVARISAVARDAPLRDALRWKLRQHAARFSSEHFVNQFRAIVNAWQSRELPERGIA